MYVCQYFKYGKETDKGVWVVPSSTSQSEDLQDSSSWKEFKGQFPTNLKRCLKTFHYEQYKCCLKRMSKTESVATSTKKPIWHFGKKLWTFARYLPTLTNVFQMFMKNLQMLVMHLFHVLNAFPWTTQGSQVRIHLFHQQLQLIADWSYLHILYLCMTHASSPINQSLQMSMPTKCNCRYSQIGLCWFWYLYRYQADAIANFTTSKPAASVYWFYNNNYCITCVFKIAPHMQSFIWHYFTISVNGDSKVVCNYCKASISRGGKIQKHLEI